MTKRIKLKICNWSLLVLMVATLVSSIQLEATGGQSHSFVWLHIVVASLFLLCVVWHIKLHFGWKKWLSKFFKVKSRVTRLLWWLFVVTGISAVIALSHWLPSFSHSSIGGVHGKIGFLMLVVVIGHTIKRMTFFKR